MNFWTPERVAILREQWSAGTSARAIAAQLGSGRNAVIGKANRLGLAVHAAARLCRAPVKRALKKRALPGRLRSPQTSLIEARPVRFADLLHFHCRYAVTDDAPFLFCGEVRRHKSPYCALHHALSYVAPPPDKKRSAGPRRPHSRVELTFVRVRAA